MVLFPHTGAVITHTTNFDATNRVLVVCPGDLLNITCIHDDVVGQLTRWEFSNEQSACIVAHDGTPPPDCGSFTVSMISVYDGSASTASSTAQATANQLPNGTVVTCRAGGISTSPLVGSVTINVVGMSYY